jgi:hypothetical protein
MIPSSLGALDMAPSIRFRYRALFPLLLLGRGLAALSVNSMADLALEPISADEQREKEGTSVSFLYFVSI